MGGYKGLQGCKGVIEVYKGLLRVTGDYKKLEGLTGGYKRL